MPFINLEKTLRDKLDEQKQGDYADHKLMEIQVEALIGIEELLRIIADTGFRHDEGLSMIGAELAGISKSIQEGDL